MSKWQDFKKKHILLMHAAFTIAVPMAVWLVMEVLNSLICGVHHELHGGLDHPHAQFGVLVLLRLGPEL